MLSKPDNWRFIYTVMAKDLSKSLDYIKRAIAGLRTKGYVLTETLIVKGQSGNFTTRDHRVFVSETKQITG
jgi:hypothetical protein